MTEYPGNKGTGARPVTAKDRLAASAARMAAASFSGLKVRIMADTKHDMSLGSRINGPSGRGEISLSADGGLCCAVSAISWPAAGWFTRDPSLITLQSEFPATSIRGVYRWLIA